jgi:hypothetical protein
MSNFERFSLSPAPSPISIATEQLAEARQRFQTESAESKRLRLSDFDQYLKHRNTIMKPLSLECKTKQAALQKLTEEEAARVEESARVEERQEPVRILC